jgi:hypothetical protein
MGLSAVQITAETLPATGNRGAPDGTHGAAVRPRPSGPRGAANESLRARLLACERLPPATWRRPVAQPPASLRSARAPRCRPCRPKPGQAQRGRQESFPGLSQPVPPCAPRPLIAPRQPRCQRSREHHAQSSWQQAVAPRHGPPPASSRARRRWRVWRLSGRQRKPLALPCCSAVHRHALAVATAAAPAPQAVRRAAVHAARRA